MAKQQKEAFVVTVAADHPIQEVARGLKAKGFEVDQVLDAIGVVTGSALPASVAKMRKVPGVKDVSSDYPVDIGPPGAPVSQSMLQIMLQLERLGLGSITDSMASI